MHSRTVGLTLWLWHKRSMQSMSFCNGLNHHLKCHQIICRNHRLIIMKVDFMLSRCDLMVRRNDLKSHFRQCKDHISPCIFSQIQWPDIKISAFFMSNCCRQSIFICMEQKELTLRSDIHGISHLVRFGNCFPQNITWIPLIRSSIFTIDITDQSCYFSLLRPPRENFKGTQIRIQIHIAILFSFDSLQRRHIKHTFIIQCFFKLSYCYSHILQRSKNICKLQTDKGNIFFLHNTDDVFPCIVMHITTSFFIPFPVFSS